LQLPCHPKTKLQCLLDISFFSMKSYSYKNTAQPISGLLASVQSGFRVAFVVCMGSKVAKGGRRATRAQ
jgi:hypothetical protein